MMQQQRLGKDGHFGRAELQVPVMAQNHVLQQVPELRRKFRERPQLVAQHANRDRNMTQQLSFSRVTEAALIAQFVNLADIVQHHAGDQQIHDRYSDNEPRSFRQTAQRQHVFQQAAAKRMVNGFRGGGDLVLRGAVPDRPETRPAARVSERSTAPRQCRAVRRTSPPDRAPTQGRSPSNPLRDRAPAGSYEP